MEGTQLMHDQVCSGYGQGCEVLLRCRRFNVEVSIHVRTYKTTCLLCEATNRRAGSGCVVLRAPGRVQPHDQAQWWSISRCTHLFCSLNSLLFGKAAPIPPDHTYFLSG